MRKFMCHLAQYVVGVVLFAFFLSAEEVHGQTKISKKAEKTAQ